MSVERAKNVPPFVLWCTAMIPTAFDDSMSYYEALCALYKFIQDNLVEPINNNATVLDKAVKDLAELKSYVDNYFENLDVQTEINNKLDDMAEHGELAEIIAQYLDLGAVIAFDTISDLSGAENLANGSTARVLGDTDASVGNGAYYKIRTKTGADTPDGYNKVALTNYPSLIAVRIPNQSAFIDEYYIVLGDSYGTGYGSVTPFTTYLQQNLGLDNDHFTASSISGVGFCNRASGKIFIEMLQDIANSFTSEKRNKITKIVVETGINDKEYTYNEIYSAVVSFYDYAVDTFPNAKVYICGCGRSCNPNRNAPINEKVIPAFYDARAYGLNYIVNSEYTLHDYSLYQADAWHPNESGEKKIAECVAQGVQTGVYTVSYERVEAINNLVTFTVFDEFTDRTIRTVCNDNVSTLILDNNAYFHVDSESTVSLQAQRFEIGTIKNSGVGNRCVNICRTYGMIPVTGYVHGSKGGVVDQYPFNGHVSAYEQDGVYKLFFEPSYETYYHKIEDIDYGVVDLFTFTLDSKRC